MARTALVISTTSVYVNIRELDGTDILFDETAPLGTIGVSVRGNPDKTNADCQISFHMNGKNTGFAEFSELTSVLLGGIENLSNYANWQEAIDDLQSSLFVQSTGVANIPGTLALASHQSTLISEIGATVAPNAGSVNGQLSIVNIQLADILEEVARSPVILEAQATVSAASPMPANSTSDVFSIAGAWNVSVQYTFANSGAGTNSLKIQGTIDQTNWVDIGTTISGVGDVAGVIQYNANSANGAIYSYGRLVFDCLVAATATCDAYILAIN